MDICIICKSSKKDDVRYGEFLKNKDYGVHTFCLYLSSNLSQNGEDHEGFLGFLTKDIKDEVKRISSLKCCYCDQKYANIGCCEIRCRRTFHLICGIENKAENRFCADYRSYCHKHGRKIAERPSSTETCLICFDNLCSPGEKFNRIEMIMAPCCRNGWFHKLCLQRFAKTSGYFFKCPLCNDDKVFREKLPAKGIFIPNQDAAWELEPNAFAELLERPNECSAQRCKNKKGRKANSENNPFVMCHTCGSIAIHTQCLSNGGRRFNCADCSAALEERDSGRESINSCANQTDDEYIDVCHASDREDVEIINRLIAASATVTKTKRDSGTHDDTDISDEEKPQAKKKYRQINDRRKENSDADTDIDDIKPSTSKRTLRLRLDSESPATLQEIKSSCTRTRFISETESCTTSETRNRYQSKNIKASDAPDKDKTYKLKSQELISRKSPNVFSNSDNDDSELELIVKARNTLSSDEEKIIKPGCKRNELFILRDSDIETPSPKQKRLTTGNVGKQIEQNNSHCVINLFDGNDEDSDSDPLERYMITLEELKRTRRSKKPEAANKQPNSDLNKHSKSIDLQAESSISKEQHLLDLSCIASRTRRKSLRTVSNNKTMEQKRSENLSNVSCIALRTRRKTICGRTSFDKQIEHEISQSCEQFHSSNESVQLLTENGRPEVLIDSDPEIFIANDRNEERDSKFEVSCIANRTRRRISLKSPHFSTIGEVPECNSDSSKSCDSLYKIRNSKRHRHRRIKSSSSEESNAAPSTFPLLKLEKFPSQTFPTTFNTNSKKSESSNAKHYFSYYPSNALHPHSSNRKRI